jgi:hypothetical protein
MFGRRDSKTELERRLRAERPQAPDDLIRRLSGLFWSGSASGLRRTLAPRIAVVCAVTAAIALGLGVAGAIGSATGSIHAFSRGVIHLVQAPSTSAPRATAGSTVTPNHSQGGQQFPGPLPDRIHDPNIPPFGFQYGFKIPICYQGQVKFVPISELFWYFTHGGLPVWFCFIHPR